MSTSHSDRPPRVLAVASHPIQYQAPWFRALAAKPSIDFSVLFIQLPDAVSQGKGFGIAFEWDIPLLEGYRWTKVEDLRGRGGLDGFFAARIGSARKLLRELRPDVVLLTGWHVWPLVQLLVAAHALNIPVVMRGEANALRPRRFAVRLWHRWLLGRCAAFLPIGRASRDFYRGYGIAPGKLFDAPYFIDNERFGQGARDAAPQRAQRRAQWGIPENAVCFCYAGKLEPKKRILDLLEALRLARDGGSTAHLLVIGTGELEKEARRYVAEHGLLVSFAGFLNQSEIPAAYACADALVLPSDHGETWGLVVNEAMACGLPALVSDRVGCGPDLVTPGETGEIFPFGDVQALAAILVKWAAQPQQLAPMGRLARERVRSQYSIERATAATLAAIHHVLEPK